MASLFRRLARGPDLSLGSGGFATVFPDSSGLDRISRVVGTKHDAATASGLEKLTLLRASLMDDPELACPSRFLRLAGVHSRPGSREVLLEPLGIPLVDARRNSLAEAVGSPSDPAVVLRKRAACRQSWQGTRLAPFALHRTISDISLALLCLHLSGFAHGDLKPLQVILDCVGGAGPSQLRALLVDYDSLMPLGLGCEARPDGSTAWVVHTPSYISEARAEFFERSLRESGGKKPSDKTYDAVEDDLYALGKTFATLTHAWRRKGDPPASELLRPTVDALLAAVTQRLTADKERTRPGAPVDPKSLRRLAVCRRWRKTLHSWQSWDSQSLVPVQDLASSSTLELSTASGATSI